MEPNDAASSSARAHELRASLSTRRDIEALLAEASATREAAVSDADSIIEEAQQVSDQLVRESRGEAERVTTDARLRAEGVVSRARTEAEDITRQARAAADAVRARAEAQVEEHRRRVRAELTEQVTREVTEQSRREMARVHERQQAMIGDIEASVRILGVSMEAAVTNISEMLGALESLRLHTADSVGEPAASFATPPRHAEPIDHLIRSTTAPVEEVEAPAAAATYPDEDRVDLADLDELVEADATDDPPRTATEAYLRSAHVDHGDPPLPALDDTDVGARYARDAMRSNGSALPSDEPAPAETPDDGTDSDATGKPLGWLFRSS